MAAGLDGLSLQAASRTQARHAEAERGAAAQDGGTPFANVMDAEERSASRTQSRAVDESRSSGDGGDPGHKDPEKQAVTPASARDASKSTERARRAREADQDVGPGPADDADGATEIDDSAVATVLGLCGGATESASPAIGDAQVPEGAAAGVPMPDVSTSLAAAASSAVLAQAGQEAEGNTQAGAPTDGLQAAGGVGALASDVRGLAIAALQAGVAEDRVETDPSAVKDAVSGTPEGVTATGLVDPRLQARSATTERASSPAPPPEIRSPLGTPSWSDELGSRVTWMVERGEQVASLKLTPEHLGPLEVRIAVREGETSVWFGAAQADTRAALEQSLPRLREMLGASGLSLANAGVFSHTPRDPQRGFTAAALARAAQESGSDPQSGVVTSVTRRGLVDLYA